MSINLSSSLAGSAVQPLLTNAIQSALNSTGVSSTGSIQQTDSSQLSPFAKLLSTLQNLQQSDPSKYKQVTQQIGQNLQTASQTAQAQGNTSAANQLSQLASDFTTASQSGQLPNIQDLATALSGHHRHGHGGGHAKAADSDGDNDSSQSTSSSATSASAINNSAASQLFSQLFATGQSGNSSSSQFDPASIILNTLNTNGITTSRS